MAIAVSIIIGFYELSKSEEATKFFASDFSMDGFGPLSVKFIFLPS
jgi:hypothetical protein